VLGRRSRNADRFKPIAEAQLWRFSRSKMVER
jgi:hypothetical protein